MPARAASPASVGALTRPAVSRYHACSRWNHSVVPRSWRRAAATVAWSTSSHAWPWCLVTIASPIAAP